ncbi:hypothetical protein YH64_006805 [Achromobacter sp. LC458]|uniref:hypothetical protein n=1 Tax=Achromobacter sp. LC458 TaxID=1120623 RepID=UPI001166EC25|nr:hypothetical protein [Achromobacter sp. LC458]TRM53960.1 hypothetical protein YH64_006805 [Achromobacter sp. LC458]
MKAKPLFPALENGKTFLNTLLKAGVASLPHRIDDAVKRDKSRNTERPDGRKKAPRGRLFMRRD